MRTSDMRALEDADSRPIHLLKRFPQFRSSHFWRIRFETWSFGVIVASLVDLEVVRFKMIMKLRDE